MRSAALGECLAEYFNPYTEAPDIVPAEAVKQVQYRLELRRHNFGLGDTPMQLQWREAAALRDSLQQRYKQHGMYPVELQTFLRHIHSNLPANELQYTLDG